MLPLVATTMDGAAGLDAVGENIGGNMGVRIKGAAELKGPQGKVPAPKQPHVEGMMKDVKLLKGKDVMQIHKDAARHERIGTPHWQRPKRTNHNIHVLLGNGRGK